MKWIKEIKAVGLKDWCWFVLYLRRNEFHPSLDRIKKGDVMHKVIKMISPTVCRVCKRDWANGACGSCTLTRHQLEASEKLERCVREHLEAYALLNNNDDPDKNDVFAANIQQTYRNMRDALLDSAE